MITFPELLSNRLLKPWTTRGLLILEQKACYVEVEVPFLALDSREVARAVSNDFEAAMNVNWDRRALAPDVTAEELDYYNKKLNDERAAAQQDYTLAAAILAHRGPAFPTFVSRISLPQYLHRRFLRGGRGVVDAGPVDFLFLADGHTPVIYANDTIAKVAGFTGTEILSIRVTENELRLRIEDAITHLEKGGPPTPRSMANMEDWFSHEYPEPEAKSDQDDQEKYD